MGTVEQGSLNYTGGVLTGTIIEKPDGKENPGGERMEFRYKGQVGANYKDAIEITATGHFEASENVFVADRMLYKCPSKYAGEKKSE
jgi:cytochrome c-type biogenesis protein CcmE